MKILKNIIERYLPAVPIGLVLGAMIFGHGCANTTTPPSGGPKDTIPPVIVKLYPLVGETNVPTQKTKVVIGFNEFVVVKDASSIYLSPPQEKRPKNKIVGKNVVITFEEPLDSNKTYTIDLTNAIADNNEGNMYPGFTLVFSTGDKIDSMMFTGSVYDCNTLEPVKGATVMLYKYAGDSTQINDTTWVPTDSLVFLRRPDAAVKTDDWGFFCLRNIADTVYRMYAVYDEGKNNIYDPDNDKIAFVDTLVRPVNMVADTVYELYRFQMTDTVECLARHSEFEMRLFKEKASKQLIKSYERLGERTAYVTFMASNTVIDSLWIRGLKPDKLITQFNQTRDSLEIWVNDPSEQPDTLFLNVDYLKTDSTGVLSPFLEEIKLVKPNSGKSKQVVLKPDIKHEDTICVFTAVADPTTVEQYGITIEFKYPLVESAFDSLKFRYLNPRQQEEYGTFKVIQDSLNLRKFTIRPNVTLMTGYEYFLKIPHRKFSDINGYYNDSTEVKFALPKDEKLSAINLVLSGVGNKYIVDLLGEKRDKILRQYIIEEDCTLPFPYLKAGKYCIRITEDLNKNGLVDTGSLLELKQPEKVKFYKLADDNFLIDVMEACELEQHINIKELFE